VPPTASATADPDRCKNLTLRRVPHWSAAVLFGCAGRESYKQSAIRDGCRHAAADIFEDTPAMQNVQPDNMDSMPLRQSSRSMATIMIRFVGLLTLAVVAMTLIWSR
jgi:hypothetical protein